jgi:pilus assembly protein CpaF
MTAFGRRQDFAPSQSAQPEQQTQSQAHSAPPEAPPAEQARPDPMRSLREQVVKQIDPLTAASLSSIRLQEQLELLVYDLVSRQRLDVSAREQRRLAEEITFDITGFGPLEPLLRDDSINDIMVNGPDRVFIEQRGKLTLTDIRFRDSAQLASICQKMAASVGRRIDETSPLVDCRLLDGSRVNVVFPPLAIDGPCLSIRKFSKRKLDFDAMVRAGSMTAPVARILEMASRCRLNVVISGGTGSGKTTMMNAMSRLIDAGERIVTIEDAAELQLQQPHVVRLETRPQNLEGRGEITQRDLLKNALRMRPDRIIVGEVRGAEAFDMLQAMNTGHDGSICTVHANSARDALIRIENMVQMGNMALPVQAIRTQIAGAVDLIVQVERMRDGVRRLSQITEVCGLEGDVFVTNDIFAFEFGEEEAGGKLSGRYVSSGAQPGFMERLRYYGFDRAWMQVLRDA